MKKNPSLLTLTFAALIATASGCGQSAYNENSPTAAAPAPQGSNPYNPTNPGSAGTGSSSTTSNPSLADPFQFAFRIAGSTTPPSGGVRPASMSQTIAGIYTDNKLQVTVSGGDPIAVAGTGYTAAFSCLRVDVTVLGQTQTAFVTNTGGPGYGYCQGAVASQTLDFSSRVSQGHTAVTVKISNPLYDNCRLYGAVYTYGCPMTAVYWNHEVQGKIQVHTNGTN